MSGELLSKPLLSNNTLFFITQKSSSTRTLWSFDVNKRSINWTYDFEYFAYALDLVVKDETLYFVSDQGICFLNNKTGQIIKIIKGYFDASVLTTLGKYLVLLDRNTRGMAFPTAIDMTTGEICYRGFTSKGFPPVTEENMSEEAKSMKAQGIPGWTEGLGWNNLDGSVIYLVEDQENGLVYGNNGEYYCFEIIKK